MEKMDCKTRCKWCNIKNPIYVEYHDKEWCVPNFDDQYLYEMLLLESWVKPKLLHKSVKSSK